MLYNGIKFAPAISSLGQTVVGRDRGDSIQGFDTSGSYHS